MSLISGFPLSEKLQRIENKIKLLEDKIKNKNIEYQDIENTYLSIKTQLKDLEIPFFRFILKRKFKKLLKDKEKLQNFKIKIDTYLKNNLDKKFKDALDIMINTY